MSERKRAKPNTPEPYLWRKPGARHLWFRYWVPTRFTSVESRRIIQKSLGTNDRREASLLAAHLRCELHRSWECRQAGSANLTPTAPSNSELMEGAAEVGFAQWTPIYDHIIESNSDKSEEQYERLIASMRSSWRRLYRQRNGDFTKHWESAADSLIRSKHWNVAKDSDTYRQLLGMITEAALDAFRVELDRAEGDFNPEPKSAVVVSGLQTKSKAAAAGESISDLFERYANQKFVEKRKRADTIEQDRKIIRLFASFVGETKSIRSISQADVREWRDTIAALPPKFASAAAFKGLTICEAAAKARVLGRPKMNPTTVNKYLSTVSPFLGWCVRNGFAERNPCDGLFYDLQKGRNPRPPFSAEQFQQIFSSPLFTGFECDGREHQPGQQRADDWRFWIPLVCLFTGARIGEIAQLRIDDVQKEGEIPFITICHDESRGQKTKSGQTRVMPLHSKLVEIGFLRFVKQEVERSADDGNPQLFTGLRPNNRSEMGAVPSRFWRDYLRRIGIKSKADGLGSHSFRHALADQLRIAGYLNEEIKVALGHNQKSVTSGYGIVRQGTVRRIHDMMEQLKFSEIHV